MDQFEFKVNVGPLYDQGILNKHFNQTSEVSA